MGSLKAASEQGEGNTQRTAPLLTVKETAAYLHMSESWVNQSLRKHCPARKIGGRVKYLKFAEGNLARRTARERRIAIKAHLKPFYTCYGAILPNLIWKHIKEAERRFLLRRSTTN